MAWHKVSLSLEQIVHREGHKLERAFETVFIGSGAPKDMALFSRRLSSGGVDYYFSPDVLQLSKRIIEEFSGIPCEKPSGDGIRFIIVHDSYKEEVILK